VVLPRLQSVVLGSNSYLCSVRYFLTLAYRGTPFCGWQRQPNATSVQELIEKALSTILREPIEVTGCGRTDAGVHASYYVAHFSTEKPLPPTLVIGLNSILPPDIAIYTCQPVHETAHARYDAYERAYEYHIALRKTPFAQNGVWIYPQAQRLDTDLLQATAALFPQFEAFFPFCKTHSGVDHYRCTLTKAHWDIQPENHRLVFHVTANRFLRGMVRLMMGTCIQVGMKQLPLQAVQNALEQQTALPKNLSVPPDGLYLTKILYPYPV
jgi:tRNA pseudouridine38-40 synthase